MLRLISAGLVLLACSVTQALAQSPGHSADAALPMRFIWQQEGPPQACGSECRTWIAAVGYVTGETPREFEEFARDPRVRGAVMVLDSDGGSVLGTLALGRAIRQLDMVTTVGRTTVLAAAAEGARQYSTLSPESHCESMCAFLLLAGTRRFVPPQAQVLVHQIWLGKKRKTALESSYSAEELNVVQRDIGRLAQYTVEMGGSIELLGDGAAGAAMGAAASLEFRRGRTDAAEHGRWSVRGRRTASAAACGSRSVGDGWAADLGQGLSETRSRRILQRVRLQRYRPNSLP